MQSVIITQGRSKAIFRSWNILILDKCQSEGQCTREAKIILWKSTLYHTGSNLQAQIAVINCKLLQQACDFKE